jgi:hypothetical protein
MSINTQGFAVGAKKYPILVVCGFLSIVFIGLLYFRSDLTERQQSEHDKLSDVSKRYLGNVSNASQLQEQLDFLIQANQAIKARSLNPDGLAENLQYFYRLESEVGIKYRDLRPGGKGGAKQSIYVPISYTVGIDGSFAQIITFLKRLEQGTYFCRITSATATGSGSNVSLTLNLDLLGIK